MWAQFRQHSPSSTLFLLCGPNLPGRAQAFPGFLCFTTQQVWTIDPFSGGMEAWKSEWFAWGPTAQQVPAPEALIPALEALTPPHEALTPPHGALTPPHEALTPP